MVAAILREPAARIARARSRDRGWMRSRAKARPPALPLRQSETHGKTAPTTDVAARRSLLRVPGYRRMWFAGFPTSVVRWLEMLARGVPALGSEATLAVACAIDRF